MFTDLELNMKLQENLKKWKKELNYEKVYAASILMNLDPEEQLYDMYEKAGWTYVSGYSPEK